MYLFSQGSSSDAGIAHGLHTQLVAAHGRPERKPAPLHCCQILCGKDRQKQTFIEHSKFISFVSDLYHMYEIHMVGVALQ